MKYKLLLLILIANSAFAYERLQGPTELLYWDKDKAYNGYTLFGVGGTGLTCSTCRAAWSTPGPWAPIRICWKTEMSSTPRKDDPSGFQGFKEVDWDGKKVWEYTEKRADYAPHHDWVRIFNKKLNAPTTLYIANKSISHEQAIAAGADPAEGPYRRRPDGCDRRSGHAGQRRSGNGASSITSCRMLIRPNPITSARARPSPIIRAGLTSTCPAGR